MASRRLKSDRFLSQDYTPEMYTQPGIEWVEETSMLDVLRRHVPALKPALVGRRERLQALEKGGLAVAFDAIFQPLVFKNLTVKNRVFRSNISGRFDNYDGSGNQARINWERKFAKGGVGAIISSFVPVHLRGRIVPNYAMIDHDRHIPFWRAVGKAVHEHDCKFIMQLSHGGRQRDINGIEFPVGLSSTSKADPIHGFRLPGDDHGSRSPRRWPPSPKAPGGRARPGWTGWSCTGPTAT